jgi:hypothetical protein
MVHEGWQFVADLSELKVVGSVDLPAMAYTFAALNNIIDGTAGHDNDAFGCEGPGGLDQVYPEWSQLRDSLQNIFGKTATNIQIAGGIVLHVVEAYAAADVKAKWSLDSIWKGGRPSLQEGENSPPGEPPAVVLK